jgi:ABC-2 type transport system permease protein
MRSVFAKVVHDQWRVVLGWAAFCAIWPAMYIGLYPSIGRFVDLQHIMDQLPPAMKQLLSLTDAGIGTPAGFLNAELFTFISPLLILAYTVAIGSSATAGEEERGTMDLLLANPIPRWRVVVDKAIAMVIGSVVIGVMMWLGAAIGATLAKVDIDLGLVAQALASVILLGLAFGMFALALGAITGRRSASAAIALMVAIASFFLNAFGLLVDWLGPWRPVSPFYHYIGNNPLTNGLDPEHAAVLVAIAVVSAAVAVVAFERRDLAR